LILCVHAVALVACGNHGGAPGGPGRPRGPVEVAVLVLQPQRAVLAIELPGRTAPFRVAQVRPRITGNIQKRLFEEGATVQAGQPLYQIDPSSYAAAVDSARSAVVKGEANTLSARQRSDRYLKLGQAGVISQQDRDEVINNLAQSEADLATARAVLRAAEINLSYTRLTAPIAGRVATSQFTEGALVTADQPDPLTSVQQVDPIYVDLMQSTTEALLLRQKIASGAIKNGATKHAAVHLVLGDGSHYQYPGTLEFMGIRASEGSSVVTLRALVPNPDSRLLPGMFVRAVLDLGTTEGAILAPQRSVQRDANGAATVLVLDAQDRVELRHIATGDTVGSAWLVTKGLQAGDRLVVDGIHKIKPGDTVRPTLSGS
jgi:membrane fusion protein (multidrug efflux system)